jgi:Na+/H+-dicarboxylate symporter
MKNKLTIYILIAMVLGIITGYIVHENAAPETISGFLKTSNSLERYLLD